MKYTDGQLLAAYGQHGSVAGLRRVADMTRGDLGSAIHQALADTPASEVLAILTGAFVGLTVELIRRNGGETDSDIVIDGGDSRNITIHAPKSS